ncbi:hypothetical protein [Reyranella sp.]|uniref:hypothetical protein n=1 Tax=Reyranella sp. TaxID=1929291 RepID=UPI00272FAEB0|nr:hypothetical protein [Reyranella sp.]MDP2374393.1 hypothetical protein [Reyranella sp.]
MSTVRLYQLSWVDPESMAARPDGDLAKATRFQSHPTRAAAIREARKLARKINGSVYLQAYVRGLYGDEPEGSQEEIAP